MVKTKTNIMLDREFTHSRDVLSAKRKDLKGKGYGNRKTRAEPFTREDIDLFYQKNLLRASK
jgi:hypothetical protein